MRSTPEDRKRALLAELVAARGCILEAVAALPPTRLDEVFLGVWGVKDLLAYLEALPAERLMKAKASRQNGRTITLRFLLIFEARDERKHAEQVEAFKEGSNLGVPAS